MRPWWERASRGRCGGPGGGKGEGARRALSMVLGRPRLPFTAPKQTSGALERLRIVVVVVFSPRECGQYACGGTIPTVLWESSPSFRSLQCL